MTVKRKGTSRVTYLIEPIADSCRLTVVHSELPEAANPELYGGWPLVLSGLKTLLDTGETPTTPGSLSIKSVPDVQRHLERLLADTHAQSNSARRTRAVVSILSLALKSIEVGSFEERLENLEKMRGGQWSTTHAA